MSMPRVSVIITSYHAKAKPYLDACVRSVKNLSYPSSLLEVLIVAPGAYAPQYEGVHTIGPPEDSYGMPRGLNFGMQASTGELMLVLNDDVILTRHSLEPLVHMYVNSPTLGLLMPYGNDSNLNRYALSCAVQGPYKIEAVESERLMNEESPYPPGAIMCDTLCLYAFLISRAAYEKIGPFDEGLIGQDDTDYSWRSIQNGYANAINIGSLVFHAGGASNTLTNDQRTESMRRFNEKWSAHGR